MADNDSESLDSLDIPEQARRLWHEAMQHEGELRAEFHKRMRFRAGDQWDEADIAARGKDRPAIVVNLLEQPVQMIINQNLVNQPGGKVSPADENATPEVAEYLQGRIRHIEYESNAQVAYGTLIGYMAAGGFGFVGLTLDYTAFDSLEQEPRIREIEDPANWAIDPTASGSDFRDVRWALGRQCYSTEEFKRRWPDASVVDSSFWGEDATYMDWGDGSDVWVGEYWRMTFKENRKLQRFSDGSQGFTDDKDFLRTLQPGVFALTGNGNQREVDYPVVTQYLISGHEVLDKTEWPGTRIPIYRCAANEFFAEGKRINKSAISDAMPSQQTYNCSESLKLEAVVLAPKPKWLVTVEQTSGHEEAWRTANTSTDATLYYNGLADSKGNPVPAPDWKVFLPPVQEFTAVSNQAKEDVKATTGFFDPALGALDPQRQSGKAILALQQQTGQGTRHFTEALGHALKALYEDVIEIDLKLKKNRIQSARTVDASGKHKLTRINDPMAQTQLMLNKGRYGVVVSVGPSDKTQQEATSDFIDTVATADPEGWSLIRDIGARLKEPQLGHYADEIATRWTPPQFAQNDPNAPPLPPQAQQAMAQVPQLTQKVQELTQVITTKQVEEQGKYNREIAVEQAKYRTEELKAATQIRVAELNGKNQQLLTLMQSRVDQLEADADHDRAMRQQGHKQAHEAGMQKEQHLVDLIKHSQEQSTERDLQDNTLAAQAQQAAQESEPAQEGA